MNLYEKINRIEKSQKLLLDELAVVRQEARTSSNARPLRGNGNGRCASSTGWRSTATSRSTTSACAGSFAR
mgnify:CR=1 FL=1